MSHERSTISSRGSESYAASPRTTHAFTRTPSGFVRGSNAPITAMERFAMGRSDSSFHVIAGAVGGFTSGVVTCPLDVIKTKLQAQGAFRAPKNRTGSSVPAVYSGMLGTARVIWREEGIRGMYRGLGPIVLGYIPTWAVWFMVYGKSKEVFSRRGSMNHVS
jgi:solute carrier family 25 (mitochondrial folate transporter), member 32